MIDPPSVGTRVEAPGPDDEPLYPCVSVDLKVVALGVSVFNFHPPSPPTAGVWGSFKIEN